jgi:hypothetical protein
MRQGPGRNDPCPCGSGKKYKKCCLRPLGAPQPSPEAVPGDKHVESLMDAASKAEVYAQLMQVVDEQLASGRLPEAHDALERLLAADYSPELSRRMIGACLLVEMPHGGTSAQPVDRERLVANLKKLPEMPKLPWACDSDQAS